MTTERKFAIGLVLYLAMAVFTFGNAWQRIEGHQADRAFGGFLCAAFWPLYWSVRIQS